MDCQAGILRITLAGIESPLHERNAAWIRRSMLRFLFWTTEKDKPCSGLTGRPRLSHVQDAEAEAETKWDLQCSVLYGYVG